MSTYEMRHASGAGEWLMNAVTRNPEGLLLLAAGAALLMRNGRNRLVRGGRAEAFPWSQGGQQYARGQVRSKGSETISERVGETARRAGEYVSEATDKVSETARSYASSAADYADESAQAAMERSRRVADQARDTAGYVVREQPWAVALAGLLTGAVVAAAFPPSRLERRTLGEVGERLRSSAGSMGERVMEAGKQAGHRLSEVAEERGLTSEGLKEAAREVGESFSSALTGEGDASDQQSGQQASEAGSGPRVQRGDGGTSRSGRSTADASRSSGSSGEPR
jgi:hypothetical protein